MIPIVSLNRNHPYPQRVTETTKPFWEGLAEGRFRTTANLQTGRPTFPPKGFDPTTWEDQMTWVDLSGRCTLYSVTTIHAAPAVFVADVPYRVCIVDLEEGLRLATRVWGDAEVQLDQPMQMVAVKYLDHMSYAAVPVQDGRPLLP